MKWVPRYLYKLNQSWNCNFLSVFYICVPTVLRFTYRWNHGTFWYTHVWYLKVGRCRYRLPSGRTCGCGACGRSCGSVLNPKTTLFHFLNTQHLFFTRPCYTLVEHNMSLFTSNVACNTLWGSHFNRWFLCLVARSPFNPGSVLLIL